MDAGTEVERRRLLVQQETILNLMNSLCDSAESELEGTCGGGDETTEEDQLLRLNLNTGDLSALRQLHKQLRVHCVDCARDVVFRYKTKMLTAKGLSEEEFVFAQKVGLGILSEALGFVEKHHHQTSVHMMKLAGLETTQRAAEYLHQRLHFFSEMNSLSLSSCILRYHIALCGKNPNIYIDDFGLLRQLTEGRRAVESQVKKLEAALKETKEELEELKKTAGRSPSKEVETIKIVSAKLKLKQQNHELIKAQQLSDTLARANQSYVETSELLTKAQAIMDRLTAEYPREMVFGDRSVCCYSLHKVLLNAVSADDLGVQLAAELCHPEERAQGAMAAVCVAAIADFVVALCEANDFDSKTEPSAAEIEQAIREDLSNVDD